MGSDSFVDEAILARIKAWPNYFAAKVGFRNHWYAACFSREIPEGDTLARRILGEDILFRRNPRPGACDQGSLHSPRRALVGKGRVSYRGHHQLLVLTASTYRWSDGVVCNIIGAPNSQLIGKRRIKVYPVQEALGVVFVFVGDADIVTPPLPLDVPPTFMDQDRVLEG